MCVVVYAAENIVCIVQDLVVCRTRFTPVSVTDLRANLVAQSANGDEAVCRRWSGFWVKFSSTRVKMC